ncbi:glutaminase family protein [Spirosoma utsteinense]|uniref:Glutaminase n=1 Tax=Spirosoma utsteinense TaxID=2585773 RepID=A0ABR6W9T4_9BACT|nr:glutaminase family protein [Spirosoma utsteinense]MBC3786717.1 hypothetical protein [Spirosoma utsteinense]MBC3793341.1 hypothetical protein [Spirosoma utsteinense]
MTVLTGFAQSTLSPQSVLNPPATPLLTIDPYTSLWSFGDQLAGDATRHWTGQVQQLNGIIRVDGQTFRFMGKPSFVGETIVPSAERQAYQARFITGKPQSDAWTKPDFDDSQWTVGEGTFGSRPTDHTPWSTPDIYVRRTVMLDRVPDGPLMVDAIQNDNYELFINGERVANVAGVTPNYRLTPTHRKASDLLREGKNVIAFHSQNLSGPGFVDIGLVEERVLADKSATQTGRHMTATQSVYTFTAGGIGLTVTFMAPLLMDNLTALSRPVQYVSYRVQSTDGKAHDVQLYTDVSAELAVNSPDQLVTWRRGRAGKLDYMRVGTVEQKVLGRQGDDVRIDWGHLYVASAVEAGTSRRIGSLLSARNQFEREGRVTDLHERMPRIVNDSLPVLATSMALGKVDGMAVERHLLIGYDDVKSVEYAGQPLNAWWRRDGKTTIEQALQAAEADYGKLKVACDVFDKKLYADALAAGGADYAALCILGYRQAISAHKLVAGPAGEAFFFSKENFSNGSIGTVDVTYPSAPLFLLYNPLLLKGMMEPIFQYSESGRWTKPFAAHDVGTYPIANGQTYGEDMPVEECGNMLILTAAIAAVEGNPNYARKHWSTLTIWTDYLIKNGFDPTNQLCTDDFAGHIARNANLSVKAIMGIASYGYLAGRMGDKEREKEYIDMARAMARKWMKMAEDRSEGAKPHYTLTFENPGTWSQKYNLVWDKLLQLNIFPAEVAQTEIAYYLTRQQPFGLPLDSRKTYTKSDWIVWTATLADRQTDFQSLIAPVLKFVNESPDRVPLNDWHETTDGRKVGFQARSVVGGYYIKMLEKRLVK